MKAKFGVVRKPAEPQPAMSLAGRHCAPSAGSLNVRVSHAKGLKAADRSGTSDPFVRLNIGTQVCDLQPTPGD